MPLISRKCSLHCFINNFLPNIFSDLLFEFLFYIIYPGLSLQFCLLSISLFSCSVFCKISSRPLLILFFFSSIMILNFQNILSSFFCSYHFYTILLFWFRGFTVLSPIGYNSGFEKNCFCFYFLSELHLLVLSLVFHIRIFPFLSGILSFPYFRVRQYKLIRNAISMGRACWHIGFTLE